MISSYPKTFVVLIVSFFLFSGLFKAKVMKRSQFAFGVESEITVVGEKEVEARAAIERVFSILQRVAEQMDHDKEAGEVYQINAQAHQDPVKISFETRTLIQHAFDYYTRTNRAFDITQGSDAGMDKVVLDTSTNEIRLKNQEVQLDVSAISKGYACDQGLQFLKESDIKRARIQMGESLVCTMGKGPRGAWQIELPHPQQAKEIAKIFKIKEGAISTRKKGHRTVFVIAPSAVMAEALSEAALFWEVEDKEFKRMAKRFPEARFHFIPEWESKVSSQER